MTGASARRGGDGIPHNGSIGAKGELMEMIRFPTVRAFCLISFLVSLAASMAAASDDTVQNKTWNGREDVAADLKRLQQIVAEQSRKLAEQEERIAAQQRSIDELRQMLTQLSREMSRQLSENTQAVEKNAEKLADKIDQVATQIKLIDLETSQNREAGDKAAKVAEQLAERQQSLIRSLNGFRFGGLFHLRLDAIERPSGNGFEALRNVRSLYRLRFNADREINRQLGFHLQLSTGPLNDGLTDDQDFGTVILRHPLAISELYVDYHPNDFFSLRGGRQEEIFADGSRFLFDNEARFNGFSQRFRIPSLRNRGGIRSVELRAGQYILTNPIVSVVRPGSPLAEAGARVGSQGRSAKLFHQGAIFQASLSENLTQQLGFDLQLFHHPNQIALASTSAGSRLLLGRQLGVELAGPLTGRGNATTTPEGGRFSAPHFQILRLTYRLDAGQMRLGRRPMPASFYLQLARNVGASRFRDAVMATISVGETRKPGQVRALYAFAIKDANSIVSQLTDSEIGTGAGVNVRTHYIGLDFAIVRGLVLKNRLYFQSHLRSSDPANNFFVTVESSTPSVFRYLGELEWQF